MKVVVCYNGSLNHDPIVSSLDELEFRRQLECLKNAKKSGGFFFFF